MSDKLQAGHEGLGHGEDKQAVAGGIGAAGEPAGKHPVGLHMISVYAGKTVYGKSAIIKRFEDFWRNAQAGEQGNGVALLGDHDGSKAVGCHAAL